ncbi:hypothetical protein Taro_017207 [Colocasia esculenta]|uniref:Uncharacterized protein n=1 Tax=Colocasia esculenta TaxID=4460 RepID=A0A843UQU6_COLES|nr:hypothetical protein [Colocasia esculenta]
MHAQQLAVTRRPFLNMFQHFTAQKCTWLHMKQTFNLSQHLTCQIRLTHLIADNKKVARKTEKEENTFKKTSRACVYLFMVQINRSQ